MRNLFDARIISNQYLTLNDPPIGEGIVFLTMLGAAYGAKKWQKSKQTN